MVSFFRSIKFFFPLFVSPDLALDDRVTAAVAESAELRVAAVEASRTWHILTFIPLVTLYSVIRRIGDVYTRQHSTDSAESQ